EAADVQFVDDGLFPGPATPVAIAPVERLGIGHLAGTLDVVGVAARRRIGNMLPAVDTEAIATPCIRARRSELEPAALLRRHRQVVFGVVATQAEFDAF